MSDLNDEDFERLSAQLQNNAYFVVKVTLFEYAIMTILSIISIFCLIKFYWISMKGRLRLSVGLQINLFLWLIYMISVFAYVVPIMFSWNGISTTFNLLSLRVRGSLNFAVMTTTPLSTIFITVGRLYSLTFNGSIRGRSRRNYIHLASILALGGLFSLVADAAFRRSARPMKTMTSCIVFGCLLPGKLQDLILFRMMLSWINLVLGSAFVFVYYRYGRHLPSKEKKKNRLILSIILTELIFNILPSVMNLLFGNISLPFTSGNFGPILAFAHTTDGFVTTLVYWYTWRERPINVSIRIFRINVSTSSNRVSNTVNVKSGNSIPN